jgi:hypothetical protein
MKVTEFVRSEKNIQLSDYRNALELHVNNKIVFSVYDGEPEDNTLSRNFSDCYGIIDLIEMAHTAGKNNEDLIINRCVSDDI